MNWLHFIIDYLLLANVVTFIAYGIDKYKAKKGKYKGKSLCRLPGISPGPT